MEFTLTVDLEKLQGSHSTQLSRILRYWADALDAEDLEPGNGMNVYDRTYKKVGNWQVDQAA